MGVCVYVMWVYVHVMWACVHMMCVCVRVCDAGMWMCVCVISYHPMCVVISIAFRIIKHAYTILPMPSLPSQA